MSGFSLRPELYLSNCRFARNDWALQRRGVSRPSMEQLAQSVKHCDSICFREKKSHAKPRSREEEKLSFLRAFA